MLRMRILLADNDLAVARVLARQLEKNGYTVQVVNNGIDALKHLETHRYDVAILERELPEMDGIDVLKTMRTQANRIPVLLLSVRAEVEDIVLGLDSGANDYLTKPFDERVLLARLRVISRSLAAIDPALEVGNVILNRANHKMSTSSGSIFLPNKEFQMMELLMTNPHQLISTERFMEKIWGYDTNVEINVVWVNISHLRRKLATLGANIRIKATRNSGYTLEEYS